MSWRTSNRDPESGTRVDHPNETRRQRDASCAGDHRIHRRPGPDDGFRAFASRRRCGDRQSDQRSRDRRARIDRSRYRGRRPGGQAVDPRLPGCPRPSRRRRCRAHDVRPARIRRCRRHLGRGRRLRRGTPRAALDHGRRLVSRRLRRRHPDRSDARFSRRRPAGVPAEPRSPRGLGEQPRAADRRDHRRHAGSTGRTHRTRRRRCGHRDASGSRDGPGRGACAAPHGGRVVPGTARRAEPSPLPGHHGLAGRDFGQVRGRAGRGTRVPACRARRNPDGAGRGGTMVGARPGRRTDRGDGRASNRVAARATPCQHGQDHGRRYRREPDRRHAGALPGRVRLRHAQRGGQLRRPGSVARLCRRTGCARFPGAFPCARRPRRPGGPRRDRSRPARQRFSRHAPTSGTSAGGRSARHPPVPHLGSGREHAATVGLPRTIDGRTHHSVPRRAARAAPVPVRRSVAGRRRPGRRQRLAGEQPRSHPGHPRRGQPARAGHHR